MTYCVQILMNGLVTGGIYSLASLGFALIFGVIGVNLAHGAVCTLGAYTGYMVVASLGMPIWVGFPAALVVGALAGFSLERVAFRPVRGRAPLSTLVSGLACAMILENLLAAVYGHDVKSFRDLHMAVRYGFLGATITAAQLQILVAVTLLVILLTMFLQRTDLGRQMIAVSDDPEAAASWGIHGDRVILLTCAVGSALAAAAGYLIAFDLDMDPYMGTEILFAAFTSSLLFHLGSLPGAVAGGIVLGLLQNLIAAFVSTRYKIAFTFLILIAVLAWRPRGLFHRAARRFDA